MRLKDIPGLKAPYVAATCTVCFAGLVGAGYSLIFLLILINTVLFDIRDLVGDRAAGVQTIPVMLGASRTIWLLAGLDLVLAAVHLPSALIGAVLIWYFRQSRSSLQYDLLVDGWPIAAFVLSQFFR
jgi:4-hydroxybenzoate polyprenyltransferase